MAQDPEVRETHPELVATVAEERLCVEKVPKLRSIVQIRVTPETRRQTVGVPLHEEHAKVKRVRVERWVDEAPQIREQGDTLIVPVVEEVLVLEKRLKLVEEIHVTRTREERVEEHTLELRSEHASVTRVPARGMGPNLA